VHAPVLVHIRVCVGVVGLRAFFMQVVCEQEGWRLYPPAPPPHPPQSATRRAEGDARSAAAAETEAVRAAAAEQRIRILEVQVAAGRGMPRGTAPLYIGGVWLCRRARLAGRRISAGPDRSRGRNSRARRAEGRRYTRPMVVGRRRAARHGGRHGRGRCHGRSRCHGRWPCPASGHTMTRLRPAAATSGAQRVARRPVPPSHLISSSHPRRCLHLVLGRASISSHLIVSSSAVPPSSPRPCLHLIPSHRLILGGASI
jgi:hypothetical protein